ncbi:Hypothetical predicted protein [Lecanosticta acicola]|uniref:Myb-like domain-containing protein n=1 Tax=Lecanosticta acicola TaxID=111012 RepID=A0AAI8Z2K4_9PEZI|nr:Hypothetical predicted protein [Lecanosticta acicola]
MAQTPDAMGSYYQEHDGIITPTFPSGTPSFDQYLQHQEDPVLTEWRKSPMLQPTPNNVNMNLFRPLDIGNGSTNNYFQHGLVGSGLTTVTGDTMVRKVECDAAPNYTSPNTGFNHSDITSANSNQLLFRPESNASRHGHYIAPSAQPHLAAATEAAKDNGDSPLEGSQRRSSYPTVAPVPCHVDPSEYQNVDDADWMMQAPGNNAFSPSTVDTPYDEAATPGAGDDSTNETYGGSFANASSTLNQVSKVDYEANTQRTSSFVESMNIPPSGPSQGLDSNFEPPPAFWTPPATSFVSEPAFPGFGNFQSQNVLRPTGRARVDVPSVAPQSTRLSDAAALEETGRSAMETTPETSETSDGEETESEPDINDQAVTEAAHRRDRDRYLLKMREKGWSYKEIKKRGHFREAESTLRGRVRVLTKHKSQRVRKPEWTAHDIELLRNAVKRYKDEGDSDGSYHGNRIPWKRVSEWMKRNGSTYPFAGPTCAKKWKEIELDIE